MINFRIKELRKNVNMTQSQLAKHVGVKQSTISRIERNKISSNYKLILKIFLVLRYRQTGHNKNILRFLNKSTLIFISELLENASFIRLIEEKPDKLLNEFYKIIKILEK